MLDDEMRIILEANAKPKYFLPSRQCFTDINVPTKAFENYKNTVLQMITGVKCISLQISDQLAIAMTSPIPYSES